MYDKIYTFIITVRFLRIRCGITLNCTRVIQQLKDVFVWWDGARACLVCRYSGRGCRIPVCWNWKGVHCCHYRGLLALERRCCFLSGGFSTSPLGSRGSPRSSRMKLCSCRVRLGSCRVSLGGARGHRDLRSLIRWHKCHQWEQGWEWRDDHPINLDHPWMVLSLQQEGWWFEAFHTFVALEGLSGADPPSEYFSPLLGRRWDRVCEWEEMQHQHEVY